jgi:hypothetical protein
MAIRTPQQKAQEMFETQVAFTGYDRNGSPLVKVGNKYIMIIQGDRSIYTMEYNAAEVVEMTSRGLLTALEEKA